MFLFLRDEAEDDLLYIFNESRAPDLSVAVKTKKLGKISRELFKTVEQEEAKFSEEAKISAEKMNDYSCLVAEHPSTIKQCEEVIILGSYTLRD